jgi:hypothetical protein
MVSEEKLRLVDAMPMPKLWGPDDECHLLKGRSLDVVLERRWM